MDADLPFDLYNFLYDPTLQNITGSLFYHCLAALLSVDRNVLVGVTQLIEPKVNKINGRILW